MRKPAVLLISVLVAVGGNLRVLGANNSAPTKPLRQAITDNDLEQIKQHLNGAMNLNAADEFGMTPLKRAIVVNRPEAAKLMIDSGKANVNLKDRDGKTPLIHAVGMAAGAKDVVEALLAKGADVTAKDSMDWTALHSAVQMGDKDMVELLVKKGADVNAMAKSGLTPYMLALQQTAKPELTEFLKQNGGKEPQVDRLNPYDSAGSGGAPVAPQTPAAAPGRPAITIDPNEIQKKMKEFQGLAAALKPVEDKSENEQRAWIQRRTDNRTALFTAEEQQFADELAFIKPMAVEEKATKTVKAIDDLTAKRKKRADQIGEQLRDQRRATLMQNRQPGMAGAGPAGGRPMRPGRQAPGSMGGGAYAGGSAYGGTSPYASAATKAPANQPPVDPNTQAQIQAWLGGRPEDKRSLLQSVHELNLAELQTLSDLALEEKAIKTSVAIQSLMMLREQRVEKITLAWQEDDARQQRLQGMPGRGGMPGYPPQPGQMPMRGRRTR